MARKAQPVTLAVDGEFKTDGMYRSGGPKLKYSRDEFIRRSAEVVADFSQSAADRMGEIRSWLSDAIRPHVSGPIDPTSIRNGESVGWCQHLALSDGNGLYRISAERNTWVEDCADALRENARLAELLSNPDGRIDEIVRLSVRQGLFVQRIQDRALFGPAVLIGSRKSKKSRNQADRTNAKRAAKRPDYHAEVKACMDHGCNYTHACRKVAEKFDVTPETVRNNSPRLRPGRKRKRE